MTTKSKLVGIAIGIASLLVTVLAGATFWWFLQPKINIKPAPIPAAYLLCWKAAALMPADDRPMRCTPYNDDRPDVLVSVALKEWGVFFRTFESERRAKEFLQEMWDKFPEACIRRRDATIIVGILAGPEMCRQLGGLRP